MLALTDFLDVETLQDIQDRFAAVTGVRTTIRNADGQPITRLTAAPGMPQTHSAGPLGRAAAPIELNGHRLGSIVIDDCFRVARDSARLAPLARRAGLSDGALGQLLTAMHHSDAEGHQALLAFLQLLANTIARLCFQEYQLRRRVEELSTIYRVANELVARSDLQQVLDLITKTAVDVMDVRAASLRLLDPEGRELLIKSVHNLSPEYLSKGPVLLGASHIDRAALNGETVYIADLANDPRVLYPAEMQSEGLVSALVIGLHYRGRPIGVMRVYTATRREFSSFEISLLRAISNHAAAAIVNTELLVERRQSEIMQRQIEVARDVQRRMIPAEPPQLPGFDLAALYTPCFDLGGDFYDFIELDGQRWGLAIADVVGKGVAASLMMASVRSSLRAYAFQYRQIPDLIGQVNRAMCRDTLASEFATMFYAELDVASRRLAYCNAGHNPPLLRRADGKIEELTVGGPIVGGFEDSAYKVGEVTLSRGDVLLLYTDGLVDSMNFQDDRYDVERVRRDLSRFAEEPARQILGNIRWNVRKFTGLTPRVDDLTLMAIKTL